MSESMHVLLVGCGYMGQEYARLLEHFGVTYTVIGRSQEGVDAFLQKFPNATVKAGGLEQVSDTSSYTHAIIASNLSYLCEHARLLVERGVREILLEKPGALQPDELDALSEQAESAGARVVLAYNRRFFHSVDRALELIEEDGGVLSLHMEFTEWLSRIIEDDYSAEELDRWVIANSAHVIDLAFFFVGGPEQLHCQVAQGEGVGWHPSGSIFTGCGFSQRKIPFTWHSNWEAPGRWSLQVLTAKRRLWFEPMEGLGVQLLEQLVRNEESLEPEAKEDHKPGLSGMLRAFLYAEQAERFSSLTEHAEMMRACEQMAGYGD